MWISTRSGELTAVLTAPVCRNPLDSAGPELESLLRLLVWTSPFLSGRGATVGQQLLGLRYTARHTGQQLSLGFARAAHHYLVGRETVVAGLAALLLPATSQRTRRRLLRAFTTSLAAARVLTSLLFLQVK